MAQAVLAGQHEVEQHECGCRLANALRCVLGLQENVVTGAADGYGRMAETAGEYMKKGQMVYVEGRLNTREWEDKNQIKRRTTEIRCDNFTMLGKRTDSGGSNPSGPADAPSKPDDGGDDDLPF